MKNFRIVLSLVNGSAIILEEETGREMIEAMFGDDVRPPPETLWIAAELGDGRRVQITIPYDERDSANVTVDRGTVP